MSRGGRDAGILRDQEATQTVGMPGEPRGSGNRGVKRRGPWDCGQVRGIRGNGTAEPWELSGVGTRDSGLGNSNVRGGTGEKKGSKETQLGMNTSKIILSSFRF